MTAPDTPPPAGGFDAVVLAGGEGRRLGGASKPEVVVAGRTLLDRALDATAGARRVVVVGPPHLAAHLPAGVTTTLEHPPGGGPVAGIDAGLMALEMAADDAGDPPLPVLVLACDVPLAAAAVPELLAALTRATADRSADAVHLVRGGHAQLVGVHAAAPLRRALNGLLTEGGLHGVAVRRLLERLRVAELADPGDLGADADTWEDVAHLESVLARRDAMTQPALTPSDLDRWVLEVADALGVDPGVMDRDLVLDLTRDVAHTVARPAVPLTTLLMGVAIGARGGDRAALEAVAREVADLTRAWGERADA